jgi:hypothetical protein
MCFSEYINLRVDSATQRQSSKGQDEVRDGILESNRRTAAEQIADISVNATA